MSETADHAFDAQQFRTVLGHFPTGVTIVTSSTRISTENSQAVTVVRNGSWKT